MQNANMCPCICTCFYNEVSTMSSRASFCCGYYFIHVFRLTICFNIKSMCILPQRNTSWKYKPCVYWYCTFDKVFYQMSTQYKKFVLFNGNHSRRSSMGVIRNLVICWCGVTTFLRDISPQAEVLYRPDKDGVYIIQLTICWHWLNFEWVDHGR